MDIPPAPDEALPAEADTPLTQPAESEPPPTDAILAVPPTERHTEPLSFTGDGAEYFRIWIVNVALTVVTFGIFSAWAKVRRMQYFYRHTRLANASFDYHGEPIAILKGRIVGAVLFGLYTFSGLISPIFAIVVAVCIAAVMPWLLSRSLRFRLHNSSYRGLRFRFTGATRTAYWIFLGLPILVVLSLFTAGPFWHQRLKRYQHEHSSYGQTSFRFGAPVSEFYLVYLAAFGIGLLVFVLVVGTFTALAIGTAAVQQATGLEPEELGSNPALVVMMSVAVVFAGVVYVLGILTLQAFVTGRVWNVVWNHTTLGPHTFISSVRARSLLWILLTNLLGTVCTLGLFWPFAQVRLARYFAATFWMERVGSLDAFTADTTPGIDAVGEEVAELFDFDIAF